MSGPDGAELPLDGIRVVAVEQAVAGPLASRHLAELGAEVLKIERPGGGDFARTYDSTVKGTSSYFAWANRTKRSITLDLKHPLGRPVLERALESADVFVHNLGPGVAGRLGVDGEMLLGRWPSLVVCEISGYGADGPMSDRKAYDLLVQAESGLLSITGVGETMARTGISIADVAASMYAFSGVLAALLLRARTGRGTIVRVSLLESLMEWMSAPLYYAHHGGRPIGRTGIRHATIAPYGPVQCRDGVTVMIAVQNEREWGDLCAKVLDLPELATDPRFSDNASRAENVGELTGLMNATLGRLPSQELRARLGQAAIAHAELRDIESAWTHEQLRARDRFVAITVPGGAEVEVLRPSPSFSGGPQRVGDVPALGRDTDAVLTELGFSPAEIQTLRARGAV